jgi:transposase
MPCALAIPGRRDKCTPQGFRSFQPWWRLSLPRLRGHPDSWGAILRKGVHMPQPRPPYPAAFRTEAVELIRTSGKSIPALARDLGVSDQTLRNWQRQAHVAASQGRPGELTSAEREELRRLRREVKVLQQEREILRKAAAFFAKETL